MSNALTRIGHEKDALAHGRESLEGKDARFGEGPVLGASPSELPTGHHVGQNAFIHFEKK